MSEPTVNPQSTAPVVDPQVAKLQEQLVQAQEAHKRALADYANLQKRTLLERQQYVAMAGAALLSDVLPTLDHLELAVKHTADPSIKIITEDLQRTLSSHGLRPMSVLGLAFDPHTMEAVDVTTGKKDEVIQVQQTGYWLGEQVLRPAKVVVGNGK
jgi:molecular chaperone GrpE